MHENMHQTSWTVFFYIMQDYGIRWRTWSREHANHDTQSTCLPFKLGSKISIRFFPSILQHFCIWWIHHIQNKTFQLPLLPRAILSSGKLTSLCLHNKVVVLFISSHSFHIHHSRKCTTFSLFPLSLICHQGGGGKSHR